MKRYKVIVTKEGTKVVAFDSLIAEQSAEHRTANSLHDEKRGPQISLIAVPEKYGYKDHPRILQPR